MKIWQGLRIDSGRSAAAIQPCFHRPKGGEPAFNEFTVTFALGFTAGLLVNGVVRRFISALYEMDGQSIRITRQTASDLATRLKYMINGEWCDRLMNEDPAPDRWSAQDRVAFEARQKAIRARVAKKERARDTRRKILVGAFVLHQIEVA